VLEKFINNLQKYVKTKYGKIANVSVLDACGFCI